MIRSSGKPAVWSCCSVIEVKSKFGAEFRRFSLDRCKPGMFKDFQQFILRLHHLLHVEIFISYADLHGDLLPINNNDNFSKALSTAQPLLRIIIQLQEDVEQASARTDMVTGCNKSTLAVCGNVSREGTIQIGMPQNFRPVSSIIDVHILPGCHRRVRLYRRGTDRPLGFYIRDGTSVILTPHGIEKVPGIFISRIVPGGLAESCGLLAVNDQVLEVNGIEVTGKSLDQVTDMMIANSCNLIITVKPANQCNNVKNPVISPSPRNVPNGEDSVSYPGLPLIMGSYIQTRKSYLNNIYDSDVIVERDDKSWLQCSRATLAPPSPRTHRRRDRLHYCLETCRSQPCLNHAACSESSFPLQRKTNCQNQNHYRSVPSFRQGLSSTHDILSTLNSDLRHYLMVPHGAMEEDGIVFTL